MTGEGSQEPATSESTEQDVIKEKFSTCKLREYQQDSLFSWFVLASCVIILLLIVGLHYTFGLILPHLLLTFESTRAETGWIGSLGLAINFSMGPLAGYFIRRFSATTTAIIGSLLSFIGLLSTSFVKHLPVMYLTYGIVFGAGSSFCYNAVYNTVPQYFNRWRSISMGILAAGAQIGTLCMSPLINVLLREYDWVTTYQILSSLVLCIIFLSLTFRNTVMQSKEELDQSNIHKAGVVVSSPSDISSKGVESCNTDNGVNNIDCDCSIDCSDNHEGMSTTQGAAWDISGNAIKSTSGCGLNKTVEGRNDSLNTSTKKCDHCLNRETSTKGDDTQILHPLVHGDTSSAVDARRTESSTSCDLIMNLDKCSYNDSGSATIKEQAENLSLLSTTSQQSSSNLTVFCKMQRKGRAENKTEDSPDEKRTKHGLDFSVWRSSGFSIFTVASTISMLGFYIPSVYLADHCRNLGITDEKASQLYMIIAIASVFGRILSGLVCDIIKDVKPLHVAQFSLLVAGVSLVLTPLAETFETIVCVQIFYGAFTGAVRVQYPLVVLHYIGLDKMSQAWGFLTFTHSVAIASGIPLAGVFADHLGSYTRSFYLGGSIIGFGALLMTFIYCVTARDENKSKVEVSSVSSSDDNIQPTPVVLVTAV